MTLSRRSKPLPRRGRPERSRGARFRQSPFDRHCEVAVGDRGNLILPVTLIHPKPHPERPKPHPERSRRAGYPTISKAKLVDTQQRLGVLAFVNQERTMKAPEREYRYRLFSTPDVNCGQEVVDFINRHSGGAISFEFDDQPVGGPEWGPVDEEDVVWSFEVATLFADSFGVLLTEEFTSTPVIQESEYAIVGRRETGVEPEGGPEVKIVE